MATNSERSFNEALARVLRTRHPSWRERLTAEQHRAIEGKGMPDLIVRNPVGAPVVVETEFAPAGTVEKGAVARLGVRLNETGDAIEQVIALRAPDRLQGVPQADLETEAATATYEYCLLSLTEESPKRWPGKGWLTGGVDDLATLIENASISERIVVQSLILLDRLKTCF